MPAIVHFLNVDEYKARGTALASILVATLIATIFYAQYGYFNYAMAIKIAIGGILRWLYWCEANEQNFQRYTFNNF